MIGHCPVHVVGRIVVWIRGHHIARVKKTWECVSTVSDIEGVIGLARESQAPLGQAQRMNSGSDWLPSTSSQDREGWWLVGQCTCTPALSLGSTCLLTLHQASQALQERNSTAFPASLAQRCLVHAAGLARAAKQPTNHFIPACDGPCTSRSSIPITPRKNRKCSCFQRDT